MLSPFVYNKEPLYRHQIFIYLFILEVYILMK